MTEERSNVQRKVNPRFGGHTHTSDSKRKISASQVTRYDTLRQLVEKGQRTLTEERVKDICNEVIAKFIANKAKTGNNNNHNIPII